MKNLMLRYVINGGKWGPYLQYSLGSSCFQIQNPHPQKRNQPNPALINFLFVDEVHAKSKIYIGECFGETLKPSVIQQIESYNNINGLMNHINYVAQGWMNGLTITWKCLLRDNDWSIKKIKSFRFHNHHMSFAMSLTKNNKCIVKTIHNEVFQFQNAYKFTYNNYGDIYVAYGTTWSICNSNQPYRWHNDKFKSLDYYNVNKRKAKWYFMTNFVEPVFTFHECVSFSQVQSTLPRGWRSQSPLVFYHNYAYNMHQLMLDRDGYKARKVRDSIKLPCGPIFCCKRHNKIRCNECPVINHIYEQSDWYLKWKCNENVCSQYRIFDCKNGSCMTLMKTVQCNDIFSYW